MSHNGLSSLGQLRVKQKRTPQAGLFSQPLLGALCLAPLLLGPAAWSQGRPQPDPPASRPTLYDPDRTTCEPDRIRSAFQQQLQPYADQNEAVLARLRQVQRDMTRRTLNRCVERELLAPQQAAQLGRELTEAPIRP